MMFALDEVIKWTGVIVAMSGAVLSSPEGAKRLLRDTWRAIRRLFGHQRQSPSGTPKTINSYIYGTDSLRAELMWGADSPLDSRIDILLGRVVGLTAELDQVKAGLSKRLDDHNQRLAELANALDEAKRSLHMRIDINEERAARIDAFGLPVIGLGILLSGVSPELASIPWLGILLTVFSVGLTLIVLALGVKRGAWSGKLS